MNSAEFNDIINHQIELSTSVLIKKAGEYATDGDRLHVFRRAAALRGETMREALAGMMLKHTVSVYDLVEMDKVPSEEYVEEKLTDHINYLLLLKAVLEEERREELLAEPQPTNESVAPERRPYGALVLGWYQKHGEDDVYAKTLEEATALYTDGFTRKVRAFADEVVEPVPEKKESLGPILTGWYKKDGLEQHAATFLEAEAALEGGWVYSRSTESTTAE